MSYPTLLPSLRQKKMIPRKGLGQHFLTDPILLAEIVASADLPPDATVIEIGPGPGTLTAALIPAAGNIVGIELDRELAEMLEALHRHNPKVHIVYGDALQLTPEEVLLAGGMLPPYYLVANLPYYITSPLIRLYLEAENPPQRSVVTIQWDVAKRIVASPPQMSLLALSVQAYTRPKIVRRVSPGAFTPPPQVESAVLRLDRLELPLIDPGERGGFFHLARAGFQQKRKTLRNSLVSGTQIPRERIEEALLASDISPQQRPQELSPGQWLKLYRQLKNDLP